MRCDLSAWLKRVVEESSSTHSSQEAKREREEGAKDKTAPPEHPSQIPTSSKVTPLSVVSTTSQKPTDEVSVHMLQSPPKGAILEHPFNSDPCDDNLKASAVPSGLGTEFQEVNW